MDSSIVEGSIIHRIPQWSWRLGLISQGVTRTRFSHWSGRRSSCSEIIHFSKHSSNLIESRQQLQRCQGLRRGYQIPQGPTPAMVLVTEASFLRHGLITVAPSVACEVHLFLVENLVLGQWRGKARGEKHDVTPGHPHLRISGRLWKRLRRFGGTRTLSYSHFFLIEPPPQGGSSGLEKPQLWMPTFETVKISEDSPANPAAIKDSCSRP
jgi:hypothetical protein